MGFLKDRFLETGHFETGHYEDALRVGPDEPDLPAMPSLPTQRKSDASHSHRTRNVRAMMDYFNAWNGHDFDALKGVFSPRATYRDPNWCGDTDSENFRRYVTRLWIAFPDLFNHVESLDLYETNRAVGEWVLKGTNTGRVLGLRPSQQAIHLRGVDMFEFDDEGIVGVTSFFDSYALARQIGLEIIVRHPQSGRGRSLNHPMRRQVCTPANDSGCPQPVRWRA